MEGISPEELRNKEILISIPSPCALPHRAFASEKEIEETQTNPQTPENCEEVDADSPHINLSLPKSIRPIMSLPIGKILKAGTHKPCCRIADGTVSITFSLQNVCAHFIVFILLASAAGGR
jgi:hypothetical protein